MAALLNVFPDKLNTEAFEQVELESGTTFHQYLMQTISNYDPTLSLFSAQLNETDFPHESWLEYIIQDGDVITATVEAKEPATIIYAIVAVVAVGAAIYANSQIPDNYNQTTPDGSTIYDVNAQANRPRLMGIIPEIAGRHKVFPDLLSQPRREYINNEQWLYLLLSVGVGQYEINADNIYIGDTPVSRYLGDIDYDVFEPGVDITGHDAYRNVYTSTEVGSTSGTSGIELKGRVTSAGSGSGGGLRWDFQGQTLIAYRVQFDSGEPVETRVSFPFAKNNVVSISGAATANNGNYRIVSVSNSVAMMQKVDGNGQDDTDWTGFSSDSLVYAKVSLVGGSGDGQFSGPFFACPENEITDCIWIDFNLPQGMGELNDDGDFETKSVSILVQYRAEGETSWTSVTKTFTGATNDQLAETMKIVLPSSMRPEVQVKRTTAAEDNTRVYDKVEWSGLKSELPTVTSYPDVTTIAIKIRGTNALARSAENKFNLIATRKLPIWQHDTQTWSSPIATQDIVPMFAHVIKDVGHSDEQLDFNELNRLNTTWQTRNDTFNAVFDKASTLFDVLKRVLAVGFAEPTLDYGKIIPVRDEPRTVFEQMYQPQNMLKGGLSQNIKFIDDDEIDGVEIEYFSEFTWKSETILCTLPGDSAIKPERVRAFGITDRDKAYQFGMRKRRIKRYRRTQYSFRTEMDALNSRYLSYCALADDIPGYSQTGQLLAVNGTTLTLDQPLTWGSGTHFIAIRKPDGTLSGVYIATKGSDFDQVVINQLLDFTPSFNGSLEPPFFMFGEAERWSYPALITDINPSGTDTVSVRAANYDERVYADDDSLSPS